MAIYLDIDWAAERRRMTEAARLLTVLQNDWARADRDGATLVGPFGQMIVAHIKGQYNSGPAKKVHVTSTEGAVSEVDSGRFTRWDQLVTAADPGVNPWPEVTEQRALLYRTPLEVSGDIVSPAWAFLRQNSNFDAMMLKKQWLVLGCGSAMIRPTLWPVPEMDGIYYPPGLEVVPPDRCFAIPDPANRRRAIVVGEKQGKHWVIWDVSRPTRPQWGWWDTPEAFFKGQPPLMMPDGRRRHAEGDAYPWIVDGSPIMPAVCQQADAAPDGLLPYHCGITQEVLDIIGKGAMCELISYMGAFQRAILLTEAEPKGLAQLTNDPTTIGSIYGGGTAQIATLPDSSASAKINRQMFRDRVEEWAKGIDPSFSVSVSESAKSGTALLIEMTGRKQLAEEMKTRAEWVDTEIIGASVATWNYLVASEQLPLEMVGGEIRWNPLVVPEPRAEYLIPTAKPTLGYPLSWNEVERKAKRAELQAAVDAGQEYAEALYLLDNDLDDDRPDGPNWLKAREHLTGSLASRRLRAQEGYGVAMKDLWLGSDRASASLTIQKEAPAGGDVAGGGALMVGQIEGARSIVADVAAGKLPRATGVAQLVAMIGVSPEVAESMMGTIGAGFSPVKPEGYDPALRESAGADVQTVQAASVLRQLGVSEQDIQAFLALRGVTSGAVAATEAEGASVTYTPPLDVSRTASKGLRLRDEKGIGLGAGKGAAGMTAQDKRLLSRARKLKDGDAFTRGEVLDLDGWLEAHTGDRDGDAGWENEEEPSAAWVEWLTQGGDPGLAWTNATLAPPAPDEEVPSE